jgi:Group II intron, maturase-specific domain
MEELASYIRGWPSYFGFRETPEVLIALTRWIRLRLTTPSSRGADRIGGQGTTILPAVAMGPFICPEQSPLRAAFQRILQIARSSISVWHVLAQLLEPPR